ncbi:nucleoside deaminase, partial [Corynebacterium durum]
MEYNNSGAHAGDGEALSTIATLAEHERWMRLALDEGKRAACAGEIPIGAVVVNAEGEIIGSGHNSREHDHDPTGHAEIHAIRQAAQHLKTWRLEECTL